MRIDRRYEPSGIERLGLRLWQRLHARFGFDSPVRVADELGKNSEGEQLRYALRRVRADV